MARKGAKALLAARARRGRRRRWRASPSCDHILKRVSLSRARPGKPACRCEQRSAGWRDTIVTGSRVSRVPFAAMPARIQG